MATILTSGIVSIHTGGGEDDVAPALAARWVVQSIPESGSEFVEVFPRDTGFLKFVGGNVAMIEKIRWARNCEVSRLMEKFTNGADSDAVDGGDDIDQPANGPRVYRRRRELIDDIPRVVPITVATEDETVHTVRVMSTWHGGAAVRIELTDANMNLLKQKPLMSVADFYPEDNPYPDVKYSRSQRAAFIRIREGGKVKTMRKGVGKTATTVAELHSQFIKHAKYLQEYYNDHNEQPSRSSDATDDKSPHEAA